MTFIGQDPAAAALFLLADRVGAAARARRVAVREIRLAALATVEWGPDTRADEALERDRRIAAFRAWYVEALGPSDGALATACAWPATTGSQKV